MHDSLQSKCTAHKCAQTVRRNWNKRKWNCTTDKRIAGNSEAEIFLFSTCYSCWQKSPEGEYSEHLLNTNTAFVLHRLLLMNVHNVLHYICVLVLSKTVIGLPENWRRLSSSVITISSNTHAHTHCYFISAKWSLLKSVTAFYGCQAIIIFFSLPFYEAHGFHI